MVHKVRQAMTDLLTTQQLQQILKVDRTTIYRMIKKGHLPAVKVGNQWRFPRQAIEDLLALPIVPSPQQAETTAQGQIAQILPLECIQLMQDAFAEALRAMIILTDMHGTPVTRVSNPCELYTAFKATPSVRQACAETWLKMASALSIQPRFVPCFMGLLCTRGLVRISNELQAIVVLGGIAPDTWPPSEAEVESLAAELAISPATLRDHIQKVFHLNAAERHTVLTFAQRIADIIAHIGNERSVLLNRLRSIAELTSI